MDINLPKEAQLERLVFLAEEAAEVIQAVTKILRFGFEATSAEHLTKELYDLEACIGLLVEAKDSNFKWDTVMLQASRARKLKFSRYKENQDLLS